MEYLENHRHIRDSLNYMVVTECFKLVLLSSTAGLSVVLGGSCTHLLVNITTLHICSMSVNVPVFSGFTHFCIVI